MVNVADKIIEKNSKNINSSETKIAPLGMNVVIEKYEENPYRGMETTESGIILGIDSTNMFRSSESGEMEENDEAIVCAKVIAAGPDCKYVKEGDDVFCILYTANPLPYKHKGYCILNEVNIMCRILPKEV